jgi:hypothetical protein
MITDDFLQNCQESSVIKENRTRTRTETQQSKYISNSCGCGRSLIGSISWVRL